ncbi:TetR/AcrR family transcriptional regulator [Sphingomonas sp.]|uniref:TetR/AcrR family transcriptional regulator n=1 Tax=Sphingomonas sp. TaxID=28214 RepID=UPI00178D122A|nr:TetR/AcrR family transcriptional regulator [Sphingomonas sp.]MBA4761833.1 TetR/AcrR family transcriptional regulator [Sphingomonas sp.]
MTRKQIEKPVATGRVARTRNALLQAGRALFAERPFDAVAIDDIVQAASVAKGTFYNHFDDKDGLLNAIVGEIRNGIESRITMVNAGVEDPPARVARAICVYVASAAAEPAEGHILLRNDPRGFGRTSLNDGLRTDLTAGLQSGRLVVPTVEAGLLFVIGVTHSLLLAAVRNPGTAHLVLTAQQLCMLMLRAFGLSNQEAELIASQAADRIIREGAFRLDID